MIEFWQRIGQSILVWPEQLARTVAETGGIIEVHEVDETGVNVYILTPGSIA